MLKQIFIPVAAFAITVTSASAFTGTNPFENLGLTEAQTSALETAHEIRETAREEATQVLEDAGLDEAAMREIHEEMREARQAHREAVKAAIENNDFAAFVAATTNSPFAESVDTEEEFAKLVEAHNLRKAGDIEGARAILDELGLPTPGERDGHRFGGHHDEHSD